MTSHHLVIGTSEKMDFVADESVHLVVTSPPYFNAPFDYMNLYATYEDYLGKLETVARESYRVLQKGRIFALNIDDMLVEGEKFPIVADATKVFQRAGFRYRERIIWKKPNGYIRISRRSGVILQNPYPMYYYPDNLLESIIIFQKGKFDYKSIPESVREISKVDIAEFKKNRWFISLWEMTNVLPNSVLEKGVAAFPYELPYRLLRLFSYVGETVLDPFAGSGTTLLAARRLGRNSIGYEIKKELEPIIREKLGFNNKQMEMFDVNDTYHVHRLKRRRK
jgi:modification methylase